MFQYYIFDLYGTLVDIHTEEASEELWEKLCLFYSYYGALYHAEELKKRYREIISEMESGSQKLRKDAHEAFPEIQIEEVFRRLYQEKGVEADRALTVHTGQFFRVLSTDYVKLYEGTKEMLEALKKAGKKIYLLSNAQRIFTEYEVRALGIFEYFDGIMISSDYGMKKPDRKFLNYFWTRTKFRQRKQSWSEMTASAILKEQRRQVLVRCTSDLIFLRKNQCRMQSMCWKRWTWKR